MTRALAPVASVSRRDVVVDAIRRAILSGELQPGERIREIPLAESLGVSRPTVRDALAQLVHEGTVVQVPYKGISVAEPSERDLLDVAQVRVAMETLAALHLAAHRQGDGMTRLRAALDTHLDAIATGDSVAADETHLQLHRALWEGSDNQLVMRVWPLVEAQIRMAMTLDQVTRSDFARDADLHRRLVDVIATGSEDEIRAELREHIGGSADEIVRLRRH